MARIARPYQIVIVAVLVLFLAWFALLRSHGSSPGGGASTPAASSATATAPKAASHSAGSHHAAASAPKAASHPAGSHHAAASAPKAASHPAASHHAAATAPKAAAHHSAAAHQSPAEAIASQLSAGRVVLLLFWNPSSADGAAVHAQVQSVAHSMGHRVAVHFAKPSEVGSFGTVTRDVNVNQTPTLLVIDAKGLTSTITGLTDAFAIEQAVREAGR